MGRLRRKNDTTDSDDEVNEAPTQEMNGNEDIDENGDSDVQQRKSRRGKGTSSNTNDVQEQLDAAIAADDGGVNSSIYSTEHELIEGRSEELDFEKFRVDPPEPHIFDRIEEQLRDRMLGDTTRLILFCAQNRTKCTTKLIKDKVEHVSDIKPVQFQEMMQIVQKRFKKLLGYYLVSGDPDDAKRDKTVKGKHTPQKKKPGCRGNAETWFLINKLSYGPLNRATHDDDKKAERGFLMTVLGLIMVNGSSITEDELWEQLQELDLYKKKKKASMSVASNFDAEACLRLLIREKYILRKKTPDFNDDGVPIYKLYYGELSLLEIGLDNVMRFVMQSTGKSLNPNEIRSYLREESTKKRKISDAAQEGDEKKSRS